MLNFPKGFFTSFPVGRPIREQGEGASTMSTVKRPSEPRGSLQPVAAQMPFPNPSAGAVWSHGKRKDPFDVSWRFWVKSDLLVFEVEKRRPMLKLKA